MKLRTGNKRKAAYNIGQAKKPTPLTVPRFSNHL
jgi:hypothetical protein